MTLLRTLFGGNARFGRYYGDLLREGTGYPTADEARRDLARRNQQLGPFTWVG